MLEISVLFEEDNSIAVMQIHGSLDSMTAAIFDEKASHILARNPKLVMLDMKFLDYISSAGVRSVFKLVKASKAKGGKVGASNRQPQISKVFEIIKALPDMPIFTDDAEMDDYLNAVQEKIRNGEDF